MCWFLRYEYAAFDAIAGLGRRAVLTRRVSPPTYRNEHVDKIPRYIIVMTGPRFIEDSDDEDHPDNNPSPLAALSVSPTRQRNIRSSPLSKLPLEEPSTGSTGKNLKVHLFMRITHLTKRRLTKPSNQRCARQSPQVFFRWAFINNQVIPLVSSALRISTRLPSESQESYDSIF